MNTGLEKNVFNPASSILSTDCSKAVVLDLVWFDCFVLLKYRADHKALSCILWPEEGCDICILRSSLAIYQFVSCFSKKQNRIIIGNSIVLYVILFARVFVLHKTVFDERCTNLRSTENHI